MSYEAMMVLFTAMMVLFTLAIAIISFAYTRANYRMVRLMGQQFEAMVRPQISIRSFFSAERVLHLAIENTGKSTASDLKLELDKDFYQFESADSNIASQSAFKRGIQSFPPGAQLFFELAPGCKSFENEGSDSKTPATFTVTATYTHMRRVYRETTCIDLGQYAGSSYPPIPAGVRELVEIRKSLEGIGRSLSQVAAEQKAQARGA